MGWFHGYYLHKRGYLLEHVIQMQAFLLESMKQITSFLPRGSFFGCILAADRLEVFCS